MGVRTQVVQRQIWRLKSIITKSPALSLKVWCLSVCLYRQISKIPHLFWISPSPHFFHTPVFLESQKPPIWPTSRCLRVLCPPPPTGGQSECVKVFSVQPQRRASGTSSHSIHSQPDIDWQSRPGTGTQTWMGDGAGGKQKWWKKPRRHRVV